MYEDSALSDWILASLLVSGGFFLFVASLGILRLPDVMTRMHASTKAGTVGAGLIFVAVAIHFGDMVVVSMSALTVVFLLATAPVAAHAIGRAAYRMRVPLWKKTHVDEWKGYAVPGRDDGIDQK